MHIHGRRRESFISVTSMKLEQTIKDAIRPQNTIQFDQSDSINEVSPLSDHNSFRTDSSDTINEQNNN